MTAWNVTRSDALREAELAAVQGDLTTAVRHALDHLDRRPWSRDAARLAARSLSRLDFAALAEPYYEKAGPLGLEDLHIRAYGLARGNHRQQAIAAFQEILERRPDDVLALRRLAAVLISERRNEEALEVADRLIQIPSGAVIGYTLRGLIFYNAEVPEESVPAFERVLALDPDLRQMPLRPREMFWAYLALDLIALGRPADARRHLIRALDGRKDANLMNLLAHAYRQEGAIEDAERCWKLSIAWDPTLPNSWLELGRLALYRGQAEEAAVSLERALALHPEAVDVLYNLSLAYRRLGQHEKAEQLMERARRPHGRDALMVDHQRLDLPAPSLAP